MAPGSRGDKNPGAIDQDVSSLLGVEASDSLDHPVWVRGVTSP